VLQYDDDVYCCSCVVMCNSYHLVHTYTHMCAQGVGALRENRALRELISNREMEAYKQRALAKDADRTFHFGHGSRRLDSNNDQTTSSISDMFLEDSTVSDTAVTTDTAAGEQQLSRQLKGGKGSGGGGGIREPALPAHPSEYYKLYFNVYVICMYIREWTVYICCVQTCV
jgi:hypothetical protein